jgi:uncharacterized protein (DUF2141 family)
MLKKMSALFLSFWLIGGIAHAEEKFSLSGEVSFQYDGDIYICLSTQDEFLDYQKLKLSRPQCQRVRMNSDLKKVGKVSFKFDSIPKGTYCILTFQDVNMNQKIDVVGLTITDPQGSYKENVSPLACALVWSDIKFDLERDLKDIKIQM